MAERRGWCCWLLGDAMITGVSHRLRSIRLYLAHMNRKGAPIPMAYRIVAIFLVLVFLAWMVMVF